MDMQAGIIPMLPGCTATLVAQSGRRHSTRARKKNKPVIFVVVGFRRGAPEINPNNKSFVPAGERFGGMSAEYFGRIHPDIAPLAGDVIVTKRRVSAFTGSDLEVILRSQGLHHIVLSGISTSGVVLSTTREAADKDYRFTILSDSCADPDEEVNRVLTTENLCAAGGCDDGGRMGEIGVEITLKIIFLSSLVVELPVALNSLYSFDAKESNKPATTKYGEKFKAARLLAKNNLVSYSNLTTPGFLRDALKN